MTEEVQRAYVSALILAGGYSKRMGQDKALLRLSGRPLLQHICDVALACTADVSIMTPWPERYQSFISPSVRFLEEPRHTGQSQGPLFALYYGFQQVEGDWLLLLACDMPGLKASILNQWQQKLPKVLTSPNVTDTTEADTSLPLVMLPKSAHGWEPLCGFYHRQCLPSLEQALKDGIHGFQPWLASQKVLSLRAHEGFLRNCNTPTQWADFIADQS